jgi:hypothetical protein
MRSARQRAAAFAAAPDFFVIASEAKQSMDDKGWIASAFALRATADTSSLALLAMTDQPALPNSSST